MSGRHEYLAFRALQRAAIQDRRREDVEEDRVYAARLAKEAHEELSGRRYPEKQLWHNEIPSAMLSGLQLERKGRNTDAMAVYQKVLVCKPSHEEARRRLCVLNDLTNRKLSVQMLPHQEKYAAIRQLQGKSARVQTAKSSRPSSGKSSAREHRSSKLGTPNEQRETSRSHHKSYSMTPRISAGSVQDQLSIGQSSSRRSGSSRAPYSLDRDFNERLYRNKPSPGGTQTLSMSEQSARNQQLDRQRIIQREQQHLRDRRLREKQNNLKEDQRRLHDMPRNPLSGFGEKTPG
mmetsp:Transcript_26199/g.49772  ORF Transcript_26199/g.49772 Transcript_26199/m.49772 type:complete len:291 (+) Transcript_26199:242-1114(+)